MKSLKVEHDAVESWCMDNDYGYGTSICLNGEQCEALGITSMKAGQQVTIRAKGIVTRAGEELEPADDSGNKDISCTIQLIEMDLKKEGNANAKSAAAILYDAD